MTPTTTPPADARLQDCNEPLISATHESFDWELHDDRSAGKCSNIQAPGLQHTVTKGAIQLSVLSD